jgi:hypothetical protein
VGSYLGDGFDNRDITGVGFQPEYVIVHAINGARAIQKTNASGPTTDSSLRFTTGAALVNLIQSLSPGTCSNCFQVGSGGDVNTGGNTYLWVAFARSTRTNYRSIGTAANYSLNTVTATNGSAVVTGDTTAWKSANRGRGDRINIAGVDYTVRSVDSETQLTLTSSYLGPSGPGKAYTIARQFTTLAAWEDCIDGPPGVACPFFPVTSANLVTDNRREVGIAYKDSAFVLTANVSIAGSTTDATHTITLTADGGNRHHGTPGAGVLVDCQDFPGGIRIETSNVTLEWMELVRCRGTTNHGVVAVGSTSTSVTGALVQYLLIHNFTDGINDVSGIRLRGNGGKSVTVRNSMIWEGDDYGIEGDELTDTLTIENCSVDGTPGWGINTQQSVLVIRNTIVTGSATADFAVDPGGSMSGSNNSSTDGSAALYFSNPQTGVTAASVFVAPNVDLHLKSGANVAVDTALNLSASFLLDIDGGSRALVASWDRGADEREVTTAVELVSFAARGVDRAVELSWETGSELPNLGFTALA